MIQVAFEDAANCRNTSNNQHVQDALFIKGQLVYFQDFSKRGHNKIQDLWTSVVHCVFKVLLKVKMGSVAGYSVAPVHMPDEVKHVHCSLLKTRNQISAKFLCIDCKVDITVVLCNARIVLHSYVFWAMVALMDMCQKNLVLFVGMLYL